MKNIVALSLIMFAASAFSGEEHKRNAAQLALLDFSESLIAVGSQIDECKEKKQALPYDKINALDLSQESLKSAIAYHYFNADYLCNKQAIAEFLLASEALSALTPDTPQTPEFNEGLQGGNALVSDILVQVLKTKVDYLQIPEQKRLAIAEIAELNQPFDLFVAFEALKL
ncbi:MAG: hypothetical protein COA99_09830 [Moraxellaceae bacterium]|nr:MAG: hypothetical protein COA99_09830 [Moraxellaceae bacterium]